MSDLSELAFERGYRRSRPIVIEGGARGSAAYRKWSLDYLHSRAGDAEVDISHYRGRQGDYDDIAHERTTLRAFIHAIGHADAPSEAYLFPNPSCVFTRNQQRAELHTGWASQVNAGLAPLAEDFALPAFVRMDDFVIASLILGTSRNSTSLHYDWGGESKLLIQLRGRKRITLVAPAGASLLRLNTMFSDDTSRDPSQRNPTRGSVPLSELASPRLAEHTYHTELEEGDIIYWPAFWSHQVDNLDGSSLAISVFLDEIHLDPLLMRHLLYQTLSSFLQFSHSHLDGAPMTLADAAKMDITYMDLPFVGLLEMFGEYEQFLLSESCASHRNLWEWNNQSRKI